MVNKKPKTSPVLILITILLVLIFIEFITVFKNEFRIQVGNKIIEASVALTPAAQVKGLSGTNNLPSNGGMLFVFEYPHKYGIWMHGMKYPLDIVWISSDRRVITVDRNVSPQTYPKVFYPSQLATYVLEVRAGISQKDDWQVGTPVKL
jgi:uncharacterized membrane protein (UPF0127 family)